MPGCRNRWPRVAPSPSRSSNARHAPARRAGRAARSRHARNCPRPPACTPLPRRILNDLVVGRYVEQVDNGLYQLGMRLLELEFAGQGAAQRARSGHRRDALTLHKLPVRPSICRSSRVTKSSISIAPGAGARACRWCAPSAAGRHCMTSTGKLFRITADTRQVRATRLHRPGQAHPQQPDRSRPARAQAGAGAAPWLRARQRRAGARCALHRRRHLR